MSTRVSNANQRTGGDRKPVFKSVLDNPFKVSWPFVPLNVQNMALARLVTLLAGVGEHHMRRQLASRKRKRARHDKERKEKAATRKRRKVGNESEVTLPDVNDTGSAIRDPPDNMEIEPEAEPDVDKPPAPPVFTHLTFGINQVTKRLESQARSRRLRASVHAPTASAHGEDLSSAADPEPVPLVYVFVCRADIDPPLLIAHLPELVAACNLPAPSRQYEPVHLVSLPRQAEQSLAETVGLRRVSVLALDSKTPSLTTLSSLLAAVQPPSASWLTGPVTRLPTSHIPTHIKQLRTSAPRDMRAAKQARKEGRQVAKEKRRIDVKSKNRTREVKENNKRHEKSNRKAKARKKIKIMARASPATQDHLSS